MLVTFSANCFLITVQKFSVQEIQEKRITNKKKSQFSFQSPDGAAGAGAKDELTIKEGEVVELIGLRNADWLNGRAAKVRKKGEVYPGIGNMRE
jgi:hypothetical protein